MKKISVIVPCYNEEITIKQVIETCKKAYTVLGCAGLSRIDAIIGEDNEVYLMEVNTQGGMTDTSDIPEMAKHIKMEFKY